MDNSHYNYANILNKVSLDHSGLFFDDLVSKGNHSLINRVIYSSIDQLTKVKEPNKSLSKPSTKKESPKKSEAPKEASKKSSSRSKKKIIPYGFFPMAC